MSVLTLLGKLPSTCYTVGYWLDTKLALQFCNNECACVKMDTVVFELFRVFDAPRDSIYHVNATQLPSVALPSDFMD